MVERGNPAHALVGTVLGMLAYYLKNMVLLTCVVMGRVNQHPTRPRIGSQAQENVPGVSQDDRKADPQ